MNMNNFANNLMLPVILIPNANVWPKITQAKDKKRIACKQFN